MERQSKSDGSETTEAGGENPKDDEGAGELGMSGSDMDGVDL